MRWVPESCTLLFEGQLGESVLPLVRSGWMDEGQSAPVDLVLEWSLFWVGHWDEPILLLGSELRVAMLETKLLFLSETHWAELLLKWFATLFILMVILRLGVVEETVFEMLGIKKVFESVSVSWRSVKVPIDESTTNKPRVHTWIQTMGASQCRTTIWNRTIVTIRRF